LARCRFSYFHTWKRGGWYCVEDITQNYHDYGINRIERDRWNSNSIINHLMEAVFEFQFSKLSNFPIPQRCLKNGFEGKIKHDEIRWWNGYFRVVLQLKIITKYKNIKREVPCKNGKKLTDYCAAIMSFRWSLSPWDEQVSILKK
jgi:hypothetical protein